MRAEGVVEKSASIADDNRVFATLEEIESAIVREIRPLWENPQRVRSLIGNGWLRSQVNASSNYFKDLFSNERGIIDGNSLLVAGQNGLYVDGVHPTSGGFSKMAERLALQLSMIRFWNNRVSASQP